MDYRERHLMSHDATTTTDYVAALSPALMVGTGGGCTALAVQRPAWDRWGFGVLVTDGDLNHPGHDSGPAGDGAAVSYGVTGADWFREPEDEDARTLCETWTGVYDGGEIPGDDWPPAASVAAAVLSFGERLAAACADVTGDDPARLTPAIAAAAAARAAAAR
jgi:hypothetical protein